MLPSKFAIQLADGGISHLEDGTVSKDKVTGSELHPGKIEASELKALSKLRLDKNHWARRVKGIGSGYWRVVGELRAESLVLDDPIMLTARVLSFCP